MDWSGWLANPAALALVEVEDQGRHFKTCEPVTFRYVRNTEKAPYFGERFQQDIEPAGRYVIHSEDPGDLPRRWETDVVTLHCPLVIRFNTEPDEVYGLHSWKARLHRHFGAAGRRLSAKLRRAGYDGVVTADEDGTREIVLL